MRVPILFLAFAVHPQNEPSPYSGPLEKHPNFPQLKKSLEEAAGVVRKDLPRRLGRGVPKPSFRVVALEEPLWKVSLPGATLHAYTLTGGDKAPQVLVRIPVELYIRDPDGAGKALVRCVVDAQMMRGASLTIDPLASRGRDTIPHGPFFDAVSSHFAGTLEEEIAFTLCRYLEDWRDISSAVAPLEAEKNQDRPPQGKELTYPFLVRWLVSRGRGEKVLLDIVEGWQKGQPFPKALERASGKDLPQLNREIARSFREYLDARLTAPQAEAVRRADESFRGKEYEAALDEAERFLRDFPQSIAVGNVLLLKGRILAQAGDPRAEEVFLQCLGRFGASRAFAPEAVFDLALLTLRLGRKEEARAQFRAVREEFAWYGKAREWVKNHEKEFEG